jgi:hypothetical protein
MSLLRSYFSTLIDNEPIADFCSESQVICFSYDWSLQIIKDAADGNPLITVEVSNDNIHWDAYHPCAVDVLLNQDSIRFVDDILPSKYFRVCVKANGTTTGNITAIIALKKK